jgi:hypothetical protein
MLGLVSVVVSNVVRALQLGDTPGGQETDHSMVVVRMVGALDQ